MGYLQNILQPPPGGQLGGIVIIDVVRKAEVASIPDPVDGVIYGPVVLIEGAGFTRWIVSQQSAVGNSKATSSREGVSKNNQLSFFISLDRDDIRNMLRQCENDEFILITQYPNGKKKIWGTLEAPMLFDFSHSSGTHFADKNGNNCDFYYNGPDNTSFYDADHSVAAGPSPVIVKFNGIAIASLTAGQTLNILSDYSFNEYFVTE